jgi:hypothetical protein
VGWLARRRSWVAAKAFDSVLFHGAKLSSLRSTVDHVITACDLQTIEQVYFSGRFVHSYRHGWVNRQMCGFRGLRKPVLVCPERSRRSAELPPPIDSATATISVRR